MKRRLLSIMFLVTILSSFLVLVAASGAVTPRFNNTASTSTNFTITSAGKATISAVYHGYQNITTGAKITSYIEKRTLGLFWSRVDIDQPNNEWGDTSTKHTDAFGHEFYLNSTGTYRATVVYEISGTGGATDVIEYEQERTYS